MPFSPPGPMELVIVLAIVVVIFGAGKLADVGGALGKGIRDFKTATRDDAPAEEAAATETTVAPAAAGAVPTAGAAGVAEFKCTSCGTANPGHQVFCGQCGASRASTPQPANVA